MKNDWSYDDIPISNFQVIAEPNPLTGEIKLITEIAGKIREEYLQTRDEQIRNALIDLDWTPPSLGGCACDDSMGWIKVCGRCGGSVE